MRKRRICLLCVFLLLFSPFPIGATNAPFSHLESGNDNNVAATGQWKITVPGYSTVAQGPEGLPWLFQFYNPYTDERIDSYLVANAFSRNPQIDRFQEEWFSFTADFLQQSVEEHFGSLAQFSSLDVITAPEGDSIYVLFIQLKTQTKQVEVTICYRFLQSYYAVYAGINTGDMPEMFQLTRQAARLFADNTAAPFSADLTIGAPFSMQQELLAAQAAAKQSGKPLEALPAFDILSVLSSELRWNFSERNPATALLPPTEQ